MENEFKEDAEKIGRLCESYDLGDAASNHRLHRYLKDKDEFKTWIGKNFMIGLGNRSHSTGLRHAIQKSLKILGVSLLVLALALVTAVGYQRVLEVKEKAVLDYIRKEREVASKAAYEVNADTEAQNSTEKVKEKKPRILPQYAAFVAMYPDTVGWLKVEGTPIDYPVMRDNSGEEFYLHHNFQGESDTQGALFVDKDSSVMPMDDNLVIYGHNMRNDSIFGSLDRYLDKDFYEEHPLIEFDTLYQKGQYRIIAVIRTEVKKADENGFRYYWFHNYDSEEEFKQFYRFVKDNRIYNTGEIMEYGDPLVMLSTCEYSVDNGRLVIIARKQK